MMCCRYLVFLGCASRPGLESNMGPPAGRDKKISKTGRRQLRRSTSEVDRRPLEKLFLCVFFVASSGLYSFNTHFYVCSLILTCGGPSS